jgi:hypothetical protein
MLVSRIRCSKRVLIVSNRDFMLSSKLPMPRIYRCIWEIEKGLNFKVRLSSSDNETLSCELTGKNFRRSDASFVPEPRAGRGGAGGGGGNDVSR